MAERFAERLDFVKTHLDLIEEIDKSKKCMIGGRATVLPLCIEEGTINFDQCMIEVFLQRGINRCSLAKEVAGVFGEEGVQSLVDAWATFQSLETLLTEKEKDMKFNILQDLSDRVAFMYQTVLEWLEPDVECVWQACNGNRHPLHDALEKHFQEMPSGTHGAVSVLHGGRFFKDHDSIHGSWSIDNGYVTKRTFWLPANFFLSAMDQERIEEACSVFQEIATRNLLKIVAKNSKQPYRHSQETERPSPYLSSRP